MKILLESQVGKCQRIPFQNLLGGVDLRCSSWNEKVLKYSQVDP